MSGFLPSGYESVPQSGRYFKPQAGANKVRIITPAIVGHVFWRTEGDTRRPVRRRMEEPIVAGDLQVNPQTNQTEKVKHFWAVGIWNYGAAQVQVWEITQQTIQSAIIGLDESEDWGDPTTYDLTVKKSGTGLDTEYTVTPSPKKPLDAAAAAAVRDTPLNLEALYEGGDPFTGPGTRPATNAPTAGSNGHTTKAEGANPVETTITSVEPKDRGTTGKVWLVHTEAGDFGTFDQAMGVRCIHLASSKAPVTLTWRDNGKGGRLIETVSELQPASVGGGSDLGEDDIPFAPCIH